MLREALGEIVGLYDGALVLVSLGLPVPTVVTGLAAVDGAVTINADRRFTTVRGCHGEMARRRLRFKTGTLRLILVQSSPTLDALSAMQLADQQTGQGIVPLSILDGNGSGNRLAWAERAWLDGPPTEVDLGVGGSPMTYLLQLDGLEIVIGSLRRAGMLSGQSPFGI